MLEFAVVMPLLVVLLVGAADYGRVFFTSIAVANAARAGAEWGAQDKGKAFGSTTAITDFAEQDGIEAGAIVVSSATVCRCPDETVLVCTSSCAGYGDPRAFVEVTATKTVNLILPYPGVPNNIQITRKAVFRVQ
ncbi:MAG: TadE/TadG family type IV pilus assembly protein [Gemmatimonadaceae bacterium]